MKPSNVWHGHSTRPSLPAGTARKGNGHLSGRRHLHLANTRPFGRSKAPLGLLLLRKRELALAGITGSSYPRQKKQSVPDGERPVVHIVIVCGLLQGASYSGAHPVFYYASSFSMRSIRYPTPTWVWIRCGASGHRSNFLRRDAM